MAELKTQENNASVLAFIESANPKRSADCKALLSLMEQVTAEPAKMWGDSIVGFGRYHYKYDSGREGDWFLTGFSPRKSNLTVYIMPGFEEYQSKLAKLGKHKTGRSCLYINKLADVDLEVLRELVDCSVKYMRERYPNT